jgi:hypothetical protein
MTRVLGAGRGVMPTWATLAIESSRRRKEKTQSDLRIGLIVASYFLAPFVHRHQSFILEKSACSESQR